MVPASTLVPAAIRRLIAAQPQSQGKLEAAWHLAVGGALARLSTPLRAVGGVVVVRARDARVAGQLDLHRRVIEARLRDVLGDHGRTFTIAS